MMYPYMPLSDETEIVHSQIVEKNGVDTILVLPAFLKVMPIFFTAMQKMEESKLPSLFTVSGYQVFFGQMKMVNRFMFMFAKANLHRMPPKSKNEYRYYLALLNEEIVSESLYWRAIGGKRTGTVFEREYSKIELGPSISKASINTSVNPKMPYLSFLAINYDILVIAEVQSWFESCIIRNYANPVVDHMVMFSQNESVKSRILQALNDMGIDLSGYRFDNEEKQLYTQRTVNGKVYELKYSDESDGTKKLIAALPVLLLALQEGRLVIIDELDAKLHPKLLRYVISMFKNPKLNTRGAQLLFTSHDMTTMKNTVFRRDEIWFAAENPNHESEIYSLYEIRREDNERVNSTAAFDKQYMEGRYGADPYLTNMLSGGDWT